MITLPFQIEYAHSISETEFTNALNCWVKFNHNKHEGPYTACATDPAPHGRELYRRLTSGEFGKIHPKGSFPDHARATLSPREIGLSSEAIGFLRQGLDEANLENSRGTPRGIVLVWSALLEIALSEAIQSRLPGKPVARTLGGKISQLAQAGFISDDDDLKDLGAQKDIRNHAAHSLCFSTFDHLLEDHDASNGYRRLFAGYAEARYHEVGDLLFVARAVFCTSCLGSIERVFKVRNG